MGGMTPETPKAMLEALARISPAAIIGLTAEGEVDLWSAAASDLFGWTEAETAGKPLPPAMGLGEGWREASGPVTVSVRAKDGRVVEVELRSTRRAEEGWVLMATDFTESAKTERDASVRLKAESRFRELLEAAPDAIIEVDREGRIVLLNAATEAIFGYRREDLLGQPVENLIPIGARGRHG